jgi:hypothetical protein
MEFRVLPVQSGFLTVVSEISDHRFKGNPGARRWKVVEGCGPLLINIKTLRPNLIHSLTMKNVPIDADDCVRKAEEYRDKAHTMADPRVKSALEAVAREFMRKARDLDKTTPRLVGIQ